MYIPDDVQFHILEYHKNCIQSKNQKNYLVCKSWYKYLKPDLQKCKDIIMFGKPICYHHNKEIVDIIFGSVIKRLNNVS